MQIKRFTKKTQTNLKKLTTKKGEIYFRLEQTKRFFRFEEAEEKERENKETEEFIELKRHESCSRST